MAWPTVVVVGYFSNMESGGGAMDEKDRQELRALLREIDERNGTGAAATTARTAWLPIVALWGGVIAAIALLALHYAVDANLMEGIEALAAKINQGGNPR